MKIFGFAGYSGSGKTTLIEQLIPLFTAQGLTVSLLKHAHHTFDVDQPGKDSYRHRHAGCREVLVSSSRRWALMHELRGRPEPSLDELLDHMGAADLVLIEGFKSGEFPKLEVWRAEPGKPLLWSSLQGVMAIAGDPMPEAAPVTMADLPSRESMASILSA